MFRGAPSWYDELEVYCPRKVYSCAWLKEFVDPLPFKPRHASVPARRYRRLDGSGAVVTARSIKRLDSSVHDSHQSIVEERLCPSYLR